MRPETDMQGVKTDSRGAGSGPLCKRTKLSMLYWRSPKLCVSSVRVARAALITVCQRLYREYASAPEDTVIVDKLPPYTPVLPMEVHTGNTGNTRVSAHLAPLLWCACEDK